MRSISHKTLLIKSRNARNEAEFFRLANIEANKEWGRNSATTPLPKYIKPKKVELKTGVWNFVRQLAP